DAVILDSTEHDEPGPRRRGARESRHDEDSSGRDEEARDDEAHLGRSRYGEEGLEERLPLARSDDPSAVRRGFSALHQRLDDLSQQLGQLASGPKTPSAASSAEP